MRKLLCAAAPAAAVLPVAAKAQQMAYISQIAPFGSSFCPQGWAPANGAVLPVSQNQALFFLLGNKYGGDGKTDFALPNLNAGSPGPQPVTWCIATQGAFPRQP
ncbi:MAG TPA: phage tail protein [Rhizomicrobium sp.]|nr:phage tail protein [Rhizomicrobium sp.]